MRNTLRNTMKVPTLCLTLGLACYAGALFAQGDTPRRGPITDLDTDGDGAISFAEFQVVEGDRFINADTNSDGLLSFEEFTAAAPGPGRRPEGHENREGHEVDEEHVAEMQARMEERALQQFTEMDANGDNMLSLLEMQEAQFLRLDRDNNGTLEGRELRGARGPGRGPGGEGGPHGGRRPPRQGQSEPIQ